MKKGVSAGGVVVSKVGVVPRILLIIFPEWDTLAFPKGRVEKGESLKETALREVREETGLKGLKIIKKLGIVKRLSGRKDEMKTIHLYLMQTRNYKHGKADEDYGWFTYEQAIKKMAFQEEADFLKKIKNEIRGL